MNAGHDENARPTIILASSSNGLDIVTAIANPTTHILIAEDAHTGTDNGNNQGNAIEDENSVVVWTTLSSVGDGSIIEVYGNPTTKAILIDSN